MFITQYGPYTPKGSRPGDSLTPDQKTNIFEVTHCMVTVCGEDGSVTVTGPAESIAEATPWAEECLAKNRALGLQNRRYGARQYRRSGARQYLRPGSWHDDPQHGWFAGPQQYRRKAPWSWHDDPQHGWPAGFQQGWTVGPQHGWPAGFQQGWTVGPQHGWPAGSQQGWNAGLQHGLPADPEDEPKPHEVWEAVLDQCLHTLLQIGAIVGDTKFRWTGYRLKTPEGNWQDGVPNEPPPFLYGNGASAKAKYFARLDFHRGVDGDDKGNYRHAEMFDHMSSIQQWTDAERYTKEGGKGNVVEGLIATCFHYATNHWYMPEGTGQIEILPDSLEDEAKLTWFVFQELGMGPKQQVPQWVRDTIDARYAKQRASIMAAAAHV